MGGAACNHIINMQLRVVFEDPIIQDALTEHPQKKAKVNAILAKDYENWTDHDVKFLFKVEEEIYFEY